MACPVYRIKLTAATPVVAKFKGRDTFRVVITASDAEEMPNEIFLHQRTLVDPYDNTQADEFCAVTSPFDLSTYPANEPSATQSPAFFRKAVIDIFTPGVEVAEDVISEVEEQVAHLITVLTALCETTDRTAVWYPSAP
jgi:hypothetical protein